VAARCYLGGTSGSPGWRSCYLGGLGGSGSGCSTWEAWFRYLGSMVISITMPRQCWRTMRGLVVSVLSVLSVSLQVPGYWRLLRLPLACLCYLVVGACLFLLCRYLASFTDWLACRRSVLSYPAIHCYLLLSTAITTARCWRRTATTLLPRPAPRRV
jgi:hypothetical protein